MTREAKILEVMAWHGGFFSLQSSTRADAVAEIVSEVLVYWNISETSSSNIKAYSETLEGLLNQSKLWFAHTGEGTMYVETCSI